MSIQPSEDYSQKTLVGMPGNPAAKATGKAAGKPFSLGGTGTLGDVAFNDAVVLVIASWLILFFLWGSLRRHNV